MSQQRPAGSPTRRRNNAPVRPPRPATVVPDFLLALATAAAAMAVAFVVASFTDADVTENDAGRTLARIFAGSLLVSGLFLGLLAALLLRDRENTTGTFAFPLVIGAIIGVLEAMLFLSAAGAWLLAPFLLLILLIRPVRRAVVNAVQPTRRLQR